MTTSSSRLVLWAGLLPILAVNAAYLINVSMGTEACFPYLEGCQSISRGLRSGPGLWLFKVMALPSAVLMLLAWRTVPGSLLAQVSGLRPVNPVVSWLGIVGAAFFLVYAAWLGTEGEVYRWLRRYGVVLYFAGAGLAHLLLVSHFWGARPLLAKSGLIRAFDRYALVVTLTWAVGITSAFKRKLVDDPALLDRVENALEWNFALFLSLSLVALAPLLTNGGKSFRDD